MTAHHYERDTVPLIITDRIQNAIFRLSLLCYLLFVIYYDVLPICTLERKIVMLITLMLLKSHKTVKVKSLRHHQRWSYGLYDDIFVSVLHRIDDSMQGDWFTEHDDVIKWKHFPRHWPFVRWIHRWPVNSPHKGQWRGALMLSLICASINGWVNNREACDLRRYRAHYDVIVVRYHWALDML